jgi:hypothetical protein
MTTAAVLTRPSVADDPVDALIKSIRIPPRPSLLADLQRELASPDPSPERSAASSPATSACRARC